MKNLNIAIIIIFSFITLLGFQNCSDVNFETAEQSSLAVPLQCFDLTAEEVQPTLKWDWQQQTNSSTTALGFDQVMASPVVGDLNNDGLPEVVTIMFSRNSTDHLPGATGAHHSKNGALRIISGSTGQTLSTIYGNTSSNIGSELAPAGHTTPLLVDLNGDDFLEIVYVHYSYEKLVALNHDGSFRWQYNLGNRISACYTGAASASLYQSGVNEILITNKILREVNGKPQLIKTIPQMSSSNCSAFAMSINASKPNEKQIISTSGVFDTDGTKLHGGVYGEVVAADILKNTKDLELVSISSGIITMTDGITGNTLFRTDLNQVNGLKCPNRSNVGGGAPTVGNFDSNPNTTEIAVATGRYLVILDEYGQLIDQFETQDCSSQKTGITSFDFNGDKVPEILYSDEEYFRVFEIKNSKLREVFKIINPSGTLYEYPIVADLDGDYSAEILLVSNNYAVGGFYKGIDEVADKEKAQLVTGIRAFEPKLKNSWMPTQSYWHQYNFTYGMIDLEQNILKQTATDGSLSSFRTNIQLGIDRSLCLQK